VAEGWVWPWWLHRQLDHESARTATRDDTMIGNLSSPVRAVVDERGLVTPWVGGWSLDWWIGAEDRWHYPSRETTVRQTLVGCSPVVETAMRVPGGDAVHRAYAVKGSGAWGELVVIEVENRSAVPFAVALSVRPYNGEGMAVVQRVALDGLVATVDGRPALLLPRSPSAAAGSSLVGGDVAAALAGVTGLEDVALRCPSGMAHASFVYALAHRASLRVAIPLAAGAARRGVGGWPAFPNELPAAAMVARGWDTHARRGMRLELPEGRLADAVEAGRRSLLLFHVGDSVTSVAGGEFSFRTAGSLLRALDVYGFHDESTQVLRSFPGRQRLDGEFRDRGSVAANGHALDAMWHHWRVTRNEELLTELLASVARGVRWISRHPVGAGALWRGPLGRPRPNAPADDLWAVAGLSAAAGLLSAAGDEHGSARCRAWADERKATVVEWLQANPDATATLVACQPLTLVDPHHPLVDVVLAQHRSHDAPDGDLTPGDSLLLAAVELARGERGALERLRRSIESAGGTCTWPDGPTLSSFLTLIRDLLVCEVPGPPPGLALCSMLPDSWNGRPIEVHDAPTAVGTISFAVRWHGRRPALFWDLAPHAGVGPVRISAPGLDAAWSSSKLQGDVLLESPSLLESRTPSGVATPSDVGAEG
jgi:hypothetical protein